MIAYTSYPVALLAIAASFLSSQAIAREIAGPPVQSSFPSSKGLLQIPDTVLTPTGSVVLYFGQNTESFFAYYDDCLLAAHDKAKTPFLGMDIFGAEKSTREGIEALSSRAQFSVNILNNFKKSFEEVKASIDSIEAISIAQINNSLVVAIDIHIKKTCSTETGNFGLTFGPRKYVVTGYIYTANLDKKCYYSKEFKFSDAYRSAGGRLGILSGYTESPRNIPAMILKGYADSVSEAVDLCLRSAST